MTPPLHPARSLHLSRPSLQIVPVTLSDIGQGIKEVTLVTVKEWLIELRGYRTHFRMVTLLPMLMRRQH